MRTRRDRPAAVQDLSAALGSCETQKYVLTSQVQDLKKSEDSALHFVELAKSELRSVRHELVATEATLASLKARYRKQQEEFLAMKQEADAKVAALKGDQEKAVAEVQAAFASMAGARSCPPVPDRQPELSGAGSQTGCG